MTQCFVEILCVHVCLCTCHAPFDGVASHTTWTKTTGVGYDLTYPKLHNINQYFSICRKTVVRSIELHAETRCLWDTITVNSLNSKTTGALLCSGSSSVSDRLSALTLSICSVLAAATHRQWGLATATGHGALHSSHSSTC